MTDQLTYLPDCLKNLRTSNKDSSWREGCYSHQIKGFYFWLINEFRNESFNAELTAQLTGWSQEFEVSKETIRRWLHFFKDRKLIRITGGGRGRGRKLRVKLTDWLKKKLELAAKGLKTTSKERIDQLERNYLKSKCQSEENNKKTHKVTKQPQEKPSTLRTEVEDKLKSSAKEERREILRSLNGDIILQKGCSYYNFAMEQFRTISYEEGASRPISDLICNLIGKLIDGRPLELARELGRWLMKNAKKLIGVLKSNWSRGVRAIYRLANGICRRALGLLEGRPFKRAKKPSTRPPAYVDASWDLNNRKLNLLYLRKIKELVKKHGGGRCPRCGRRITRTLWEDAALAFREKGLCSCLAVARVKLPHL